jgi:hypothetical protein
VNRRRGGNGRLCRRCGNCGTRRRRSRLLLLLLQDGLQHIAGLGNFGEIDLGFRRSFDARGAGQSGLAALELNAHTLGLIFFKRTGVRLLLGNTDNLENIKNRFALDFQLAC